MAAPELLGKVPLQTFFGRTEAMLAQHSPDSQGYPRPEGIMSRRAAA